MESRNTAIKSDQRIERLSERERVAMIRAFDELVPKIPVRPAAEVNRELSTLKAEGRAGGRQARSVIDNDRSR